MNERLQSRSRGGLDLVRRFARKEIQGVYTRQRDLYHQRSILQILVSNDYLQRRYGSEPASEILSANEIVITIDRFCRSWSDYLQRRYGSKPASEMISANEIVTTSLWHEIKCGFYSDPPGFNFYTYALNERGNIKKFQVWKSTTAM